jgi:hypothetical protein
MMAKLERSYPEKIYNLHPTIGHHALEPLFKGFKQCLIGDSTLVSA